MAFLTQVMHTKTPPRIKNNKTQIAQGCLMSYLHLEDVFFRVFAHLQDVYRRFPADVK